MTLLASSQDVAYHSQSRCPTHRPVCGALQQAGRPSDSPGGRQAGIQAGSQGCCQGCRRECDLAGSQGSREVGCQRGTGIIFGEVPVFDILRGLGLRRSRSCRCHHLSRSLNSQFGSLLWFGIVQALQARLHMHPRNLEAQDIGCLSPLARSLRSTPRLHGRCARAA